MLGPLVHEATRGRPRLLCLFCHHACATPWVQELDHLNDGGCWSLCPFPSRQGRSLLAVTACDTTLWDNAGVSSDSWVPAAAISLRVSLCVCQAGC